MGKILIDNQLKEVQDPYIVRCDANDKKHKGVYSNGFLTIDKNGVLFIFEQIENRLRLHRIQVSVRLGENKNNTIKMPAHIFGELAFTELGFKLIDIDHFVQMVRGTDSSFQQKRSALWTLGHVGQSKYGIKLIKDLKLIPDIVKMAEQYPVLSLRGTCLYCLNMICTTSVGRKELEKA